MKGLDIKTFLAREGERLGIHKQEELAAKIGVSDQTVSNWVKGKTFPTHQTEVELYEMGMTTEELFGKAYRSAVKTESDMDEVVARSLKRIVANIGKI